MSLNANHVTNLLNIDGTTVDLIDINSGIEAFKAQISQGRLTLTSNTPVLSSNVTNATTLYYTPYTGSQISIWDGSKWVLKTFTQLSLSLSGLTANTLYDVFIYDSNGTLTLESVAWSNSGAGTSTRASALTYLNGVRVKSSDNRKYLGSFLCNSTGGQVDFITRLDGTPASNGFFNEFNKEDLLLTIIDSTNHTYATSAWRIWRNNANNTIKVVCPNSAINIYYKGFVGVVGSIMPFINDEFYLFLLTSSGSNSSYLSTGGDVLLASGYHKINLAQYGDTSNTSYSNMTFAVSLQY
jgi:hypothetical protein